MSEITMSATYREDFAFKHVSTRYSTHAMHPYVAAMVPALAARMIDETSPQRLLDPFCGGGSVCVEGIRAGIPTTGVDINLLSQIVSAAKTTWLDRDIIHERSKDIMARARHAKPHIDNPDDHDAYRIDYWFRPDTIRDLSRLAAVINGMRRSDLKTFFQCVLSGTVRDSMLTYRNEVRLHRLRQDDLDRFKPDVFKTFRKRVLAASDMVDALPRRSKADIRHGDVTDLPFKNRAFTTIVCSPPYGDERNGVCYTQFSKCMLYWLGIPKKILNFNKRRILGWCDIQTDKPLPPSSTLRNARDMMGRERSRMELGAFYHDYDLALREMARVTSDRVVIVTGNRVLDSTVVNNAAATIELMAGHDMALVSHYQRNLPSKRIPRFGKISSMNGGCIDKEDIMVFVHGSKA